MGEVSTPLFCILHFPFLSQICINSGTSDNVPERWYAMYFSMPAVAFWSHYNIRFPGNYYNGLKKIIMMKYNIYRWKMGLFKYIENTSLWILRKSATTAELRLAKPV